MLESEFKDKILPRLAPHFIIQEEVSGVVNLNGYTHRVRIDALLYPKDKTGWKNPDVVLGLEFKEPDLHIGKLTNALDQIEWYTLADFNGLKHFPVFVCPPFKQVIRRYFATEQNAKEAHFIFSRMLGKKLIGELRNTARFGLTFYLNGDHEVWSEEHGVMHEGKRNMLIRKIGSGKHITL